MTNWNYVKGHDFTETHDLGLSIVFHLKIKKKKLIKRTNIKDIERKFLKREAHEILLHTLKNCCLITHLFV